MWRLIKVEQEVKHRHFLGHFFCVYIQTNSAEVILNILTYNNNLEAEDFDVRSW